MGLTFMSVLLGLHGPAFACGPLADSANDLLVFHVVNISLLRIAELAKVMHVRPSESNRFAYVVL